MYRLVFATEVSGSFLCDREFQLLKRRFHESNRGWHNGSTLEPCLRQTSLDISISLWNGWTESMEASENFFLWIVDSKVKIRNSSRYEKLSWSALGTLG